MSFYQIKIAYILLYIAIRDISYFNFINVYNRVAASYIFTSAIYLSIINLRFSSSIRIKALKSDSDYQGRKNPANFFQSLLDHYITLQLH